ncbi:hypothetical protein AACH06_14685 [Ideonella sp. DXS29W]|uniref:Calcium-binding protein n=1 Tax=Ideonella lacteola TaxID=2984193 RepID=A0ABU9BT40_9BURK
MTIYLYSAIADGNSISFDPDVDVLSIDTGSFSAADFTLTVLPDGAGVQWSNGSKTFTLASVNLAELNQDNVQFSDGSLLVNSCSANGFATDLSGSSHDDLLLGFHAAQGIDRISETVTGSAGDRQSLSPDVSSTGRYVVFSSDSTTIAGGDSNSIYDIFLKDLQTGSLYRVSTTSTGKPAGPGDWGTGSLAPSVSSNGRYVAFESSATDLVTADTNQTNDIFLKDRQTGTLTRVSTSSSGTQSSGGGSYGASLSADGHVVAFESDALNLVSGDANDARDIFVKNAQTGAVTLASSTSAGVQGNGWSTAAVLSGDGQFVLFKSWSTNLVENDTNGKPDWFVKNVTTDDIVCVNEGFSLPDYSTAVMSEDGHHVVFRSDDTVLNDGQDGIGGVYLKNLQTGELSRVIAAGGYNEVTAVSDGGRFVVFTTSQSLVETDTNGYLDVYVEDMLTGRVARVSVGAHGEQAMENSFGASISADGTTISFCSDDSDLVGQPDSSWTQVFAVDNPLAGWTLRGRGGDDVYRVDRQDLIIEAADEGTDSVQSSVSFVLSDNVERLLLTGSAAIDGQGNSQDNQITGNTATNKISGGAGNDTLDGGAGIDTASYQEATSAVTVSLAVTTAQVTGGAGTDRLVSFENLTGSAHADRLTGSATANVLDGKAGADTLTGGAGNDTYVLDNLGDLVVEWVGGGIDTIESLVSFTLAGQVEQLVLLGTADIDGIGNTLANTITGNNSNNILDGGAGADTLIGGWGEDTYVVDNAGDVLVETHNDNFSDTVESSVSWTLEESFEKLTLTGSAAINGTGNSASNVITGNDAANVLSGGSNVFADNDQLIGRGGNDTYYVDFFLDSTVEVADGGVDTVVAVGTGWVLQAETENLILQGADALNGTGNAKDNMLTGNSGDNVLNGAAGADTMVGGAGYDIYVVDNASDVTTETADGSVSDDVEASVSWTLSNYIENLRLTGSAAINGTGNVLDNFISGNAAANVLNGAGGADVMLGGAGNDTYVADNTDDRAVEEVNAGVDLVQSSASYTLPAHVENLILTGASAVSGTGNTQANSIIGNAASNLLDGGAGVDTLTGAGGNDIYVVDNTGDKTIELAGGGTDRVQASISVTLQAEIENLTLTGASAINGTGNALNNVLAGNVAANVLTGGAGNDTYVVDNFGDKTIELDGGGTDLVQSSISHTLQAEVEKLTLTGSAAINGTGNAMDNTIAGNSAPNVLSGGAGADSMTGGSGNDTYVVDNAGDQTIELAAGGVDLVQTTITWTLAANIESLTLTGSAALHGTGNALANAIHGNSGDNVLDGAAGADTLMGGEGNDTYVVDNTSDDVVETAGGGADLVLASASFTLQAEVEKLTLTGVSAIDGIGNDEDNVIVGNAAGNVLDGGAGTDTLTGGAGNDVYVVDNVGDRTVEVIGAGTDLVQSSVSFTLQAEVENLKLTGTAAINGTGNALANVITGNAANNVLKGGAGADTMTGGTGSDTYVVDNYDDRTIEAIGGGIDLVQSSVSFTLQDSVENLTLTGTSNIDGTGNALANILTGNSAGNVLTGGAGNDTYIVDNTDDRTIELAGGGTDLVQTSISLTLQAEVENLSLVGSSAINGTGNTLVNTIAGNMASNVLNGGAGADSMVGGAGNDTYVVDNAGDKIVEAIGGGIDLVQSSVSFTLQDLVENLTLTGISAINGTGNAVANVITGNAADNVLSGGAGLDTMTGGAGNDIFALTSPLGSDLITDFNGGADKLSLNQASLRIGDGDRLVEGGVRISGPNGFKASAELVVFTHDIVGSITATSAAAAIGHADSNYAAGDTRLFVVDNGVDSAVYLFKSADANAIVSASELTLLATLDNNHATVVTDYLFGG